MSLPVPMPVLSVAVAAPLRNLFDYLPPAGVAAGELLPGMRLRVPFGRSSRIGVLIAVKAEGDTDRRRLKPAEVVLDREPLLSPDDLRWLRWAADYYRHPVGEVLAAALPALLRRGEPLDTGALPGWRLTPDGHAFNPDALLRAPRQAEVFDYLQQADGAVSRDELYAACGDCRAQLKALEGKGLVEAHELQPEQVIADPTASGPELNAEQAAAVAAVSECEGFGAFLLDGVTGSGKTEVYLRLVARAVAAGRQVLVLVPEISLTPQLLRRFRRSLRASLSLMHSGLTDNERARLWWQAAQGLTQVVIGTRSAVFTPLPRLGLIVVDEEHDLSFKQQDGFRYSARDLAVVRARQAGCPVLLGSATPSLESLHNARAERYRALHLRRRAGEARPPRMDLLDIRSQRLEAGVSPTLRRLIADELEKGHQVLLFLNRRGYAPVLTCHACGWVAQCRRCDARMTLHAASHALWCHHCGSQRREPEQCPECGAGDLRTLGQGTEQLEGALAHWFPDHPVARIDRDSTRRKGSLEHLLEAIRAGDYRLLLGTQMLAKGHHFPDVTLVCLLDVDQGLFGADFRAPERLAQLIVQVAGRAGRAEKPGRVLIQTRHPDHPLLQTLLHQGYAAFAEAALQERRELLYPPFGYQALFRAEATEAGPPRDFLDEVYEAARPLADPGVELWGPVPAPMERRAGRYRAHLLVQAPQRTSVQQLLAQLLPLITAMKSARRVRWSLDVDPQEML